MLKDRIAELGGNNRANMKLITNWKIDPVKFQ